VLAILIGSVLAFFILLSLVFLKRSLYLRRRFFAAMRETGVPFLKTAEKVRIP
jgi:hypothetical protein